MTIAFTICSNNYLSQAKTLFDSIQKVNPEIKFYVGLLDRFEDLPIEYQQHFESLDIIQVNEVDIPAFDWMNENYDIIELNTAIKPFYFQHFFKSANKVIYLDPDIYCFKSLDHIVYTLDEYNAVLTPHLTVPINDDPSKFVVHEKEMLNHGIYNLGFTAIKNNEEGQKMVNWWAERLEKQCFHNLCQGLFVDQLWCNLMPIYFDKVKIDKHLGLNMAYWNLYERTLSKKDGHYFVNENTPLIFFHFSNFNPHISHNIAQKQNRYTLENRPDLVELYDFYTEKVEGNHYTALIGKKCAFGKQAPPVKRYKRLRKWASWPFRKVTKVIEEIL